MDTMLAAVLTARETIEMRDVPKPSPGPGEVLIKITHVGVCGSDLHFYQHGRIGDFKVTYPLILGHESAGEVVELGDGVKTLQKGDRVALEPGITCGQCFACKSGHYNLCPGVRFFAAPPYDGTLCEYVAHPESVCFKLPDNVDSMSGALIEPLAVAFHAMMQGDARVGQTALVLGSGCIGLCSVLALKAAGVGKIYITDLYESRLSKARELGAIPIKEPEPQSVDLVVETAGAPASVLGTVDYVRYGGTIVLVGLAPESVLPFNIGNVINHEITVKSVFRYCNRYPAAIAAVENGLPLNSIVTNTYSFEDTAKAFADCAANKRDIVKAVITL